MYHNKLEIDGEKLRHTRKASSKVAGCVWSFEPRIIVVKLWRLLNGLRCDCTQVYNFCGACYIPWCRDNKWGLKLQNKEVNERMGKTKKVMSRWSWPKSHEETGEKFKDKKRIMVYGCGESKNEWFALTENYGPM